MFVPFPLPRPLLSTFLLAALVFAPFSLPGQSAAVPISPALPSPAAQLSPAAELREALHPLEVTRHDIQNWSDTEVAALTVAIARAKSACDARTSEAFTGGELLDYARLCALGQQWPNVVTATSRYITAPGVPKPQRTDAYLARIDAELRLKNEPAAFTDAQTVLTTAAYTAEVAATMDEAIDYMRFVYSADALTLATVREPILLQALRIVSAPAGSPPARSGSVAEASPGTNPAANPLPLALPVHQYYAEGVALAALQELLAKPEAAQSTMLALNAALPQPLAQDEAIFIAGERNRYALLGHSLMALPLRRFLQTTGKLPPVPALRTITALLLFPDWCAACVRLGAQLPETVVSVEGHGAYIYGLLAETVPSRQPPSHTAAPSFQPGYAATLLAGTATFTTPGETLRSFSADDFPLLILADSHGIVRVLQPVGTEDLQGGGSVDAAIALVGKTFPTVLPKDAEATSPAVKPLP